VSNVTTDGDEDVDVHASTSNFHIDVEFPSYSKVLLMGMFLTYGFVFGK